MLVDRGCYERGCACVDDRVDKDTVVIPDKKWQRLSLQEIAACFGSPDTDSITETQLCLYLKINQKLKEKNT